MARQAYKSSVVCNFINIETGESENIIDQCIKYIIIEHKYEERYMPIIYLSLTLKSSLYTKVLDGTKNCKFYLKISNYNAFSNLSLNNTYIEGQFSYILSTNAPNYSYNLVPEEESADLSYRQITIALMSMQILNNAKESFNGIYGDIDQNTLLLKVLDGQKAVVKTPLYNPNYDTIIIPPFNSKSKLINHIFTLCPFYNTNYMYFIDFNCTYLLDYSGEYVSSGDKNEKPTIIFDIKDITEKSSYADGMEDREDHHYVWINPAYTKTNLNNSNDKITNQYVFIDDDGSVQCVDVDDNDTIDSTLKQTFVKGYNPVIYKNTLNSSTMAIELNKTSLDSSIFTPNKRYYIANYTKFNEYKGNYMLSSKTELIGNVNGSFNTSLSIVLKKIGEIVPIDKDVAKTAEKQNNIANQYVSYASKRASDSSIRR